ncbi:MAG: tyrosine-type recombinase/integrase [Nitrosopumilus sp.]|nr:tyrosine-type recombinase/integrase [Nitrosopumilus sp.]MDA7958132.1 tyrosine-type recombinase/integrase [Nitrosopumilus sp.]
MDDDIHKSKYRVGLELKKVAKRHPGRNYEIVCRYVDRLRMNNISMGRIANYAAGASKMLEICGAPVPEWTREDVENIHRYITSSDYSNIVKKDMLTGLKRLYHFAMHDELPNKAAGGRYDPMVDWIVPNKFTQRHRKVQAMDLLTEEELLGLVQAVKDSGRHVRRDVALIFMMLEGAYRPGEILSIKVGGVELHDGFAKVITTGKTGPKVLTLVSSQGPLREWLAEHPRNDDPEAYLFFHGNARGVMPYSTLVYTIRAAQKRAGIKKRIWPYLFRHTALTEYSKLMGNVAKVYGNWATSSNMISVYEHLASSDQEDAVLRLHGMRSERRRSPILFARECPSCAMVNSADREACARCGTSLEGAGHPMEGGAAGGRKGRGRAPARRAAPKAGAAPEPRDDVDARIKRLEEANARLQGMVGDLLARLGQ